jgi:hypothetical protein
VELGCAVADGLQGYRTLAWRDARLLHEPTFSGGCLDWCDTGDACHEVPPGSLLELDLAPSPPDDLSILGQEVLLEVFTQEL